MRNEHLCQYYHTQSNSRCTFADLVPDNSFLPSTNERLEFDLALILLGIACQRGLFVQTLEVGPVCKRHTQSIN